jgi:PAS domain-containing protein
MEPGFGSRTARATSHRQHELEMIVLRQAASYLATPIFIVDGAGTLVFYNEPAEYLLGRRYDEAGEMPLDQWGSVFTPTDDDGEIIPAAELPLAITVAEQRPANGHMHIVGLDGRARRIEVTALPLIGRTGRHLGSFAVFWETGGTG